MKTQERMKLLLLSEKINRNPGFAKQTGITVRTEDRSASADNQSINLKKEGKRYA